MKKAIKIFTIIGMVATFYLIFPVIFGAITLKKLEKGEITNGWKVCVFLFVSMIAGIMMFATPTEEINAQDNN